jgi:hypothetical protein
MSKTIKAEMRDLSQYQPADLDVLGYLRHQIAREKEVLGAPYSVRCYPTPYLLKLAQQLTELTGTPHVYNANYFSIRHNPDLSVMDNVIVGSNNGDDFRYYSGDFRAPDAKNLDYVSQEDRSFKLNIGATDLYQALNGNTGEASENEG